MSDKIITKYANRQSFFRRLSYVLGIISFCCFLILIAEGSNLSIWGEFIVKVGALSAFAVFALLSSLSSYKAMCYSKKIKKSQSRLFLKGKSSVEIPAAISSIEKWRKDRARRNINIEL